ncbi:MAG: shikimate dehydrogenase [Candidatus Altiarchaeota archaeon]
MKKFCLLLGGKIEHSISPVMQNAAFARLGLDIEYKAMNIHEKDLNEMVEMLRRKDMLGANVTIPYKISMLKFMDSVDKTTKKIGAINTIVNENGKLKGFNTDTIGFSEMIKRYKIILEDKKVLIIGAGGVARAIAFQCVLEGARVSIFNRTAKRAEELKDRILNELGKEIIICQISEIKKADILINATSVGMFPKINETLVSRNLLHSRLVVIDVIYNPLETKLLREAKKVGCRKRINGVEMLVQQGAASFELWTKRKAPIELMRKVVITELMIRNGLQ